MKVGITGATGFIGSQVSVDCAAKGHEPIAFSRRPAADGRLLSLDAVPDLSGLDAVVNLAKTFLGCGHRRKNGASAKAAS